MNKVAEDILKHYGVKRRSGRYPWGSGDNPYQRSADFIARVEELTSLGLSETEVATKIGLSTTELRMQLKVAKHQRRELEVDRAKSLRSDGNTLVEIAQIMGYKNESSVRALLNENTSINKNKANVTADVLRKELESKRIIDVGVGVERELGISKHVLKEAIFILESEGYLRDGFGVSQVTNTKNRTTVETLRQADITYKDVCDDLAMIQPVINYHSKDGGLTFDSIKPPASINSNRIYIRYGDEGGSDKDGVIELRRGVADLDLGNSQYAQVRILVDKKQYLKGMAMYTNDIPDGTDIIFNTNKKSGTDKKDVFKNITSDPDNPFGATIKANGQSYYSDKNGKEKLSAINKIKEEGDWDKMSKNLSSQFLSKQPLQLINKQLNLTLADKVSEYDTIMSLTNPVIKKKLLLDFANECESAAVHLKAAALPRQSTQVILPITSMSDKEIYAPNYRNGEKVALIRYPHGGTFEIPELTVNNKNRSARMILGENISDAVGINPKVAERLSGADFDGDQVVVIPLSKNVRVKSTPALRGLENFNAKDEYAEVPGMKYMTKANTQKQMGVVSNLITDMTLKGAPEREIVRAVKHSMVVIDAEKHKLNYSQSEKDNGIAALKKAYQGRVDDNGKTVGGASTLLSRRKQTIDIPERKGSPNYDKSTGEVSYKQSGRTYVDKKGETVLAKTKVNLITDTNDIRTLSSGTTQEHAYAMYANKIKALSNDARKNYILTKTPPRDASARTAYPREVETLGAKLGVAEQNAPRERTAQGLANSVIRAKKQENPAMDKKEIQKASQLAITNARIQVGASGKNSKIDITDKEWEAIQARAVSPTTLTRILRFTDNDILKQRAMPRDNRGLTTAQANKIRAMAASGYTNAEIAAAIGVSPSTVSTSLRT